LYNLYSSLNTFGIF